MNINTYHMVEGAKQAKGVAVIIDVFRAFSVECYLYQNHVAEIIPVADMDIAFAIKEQHPDYILIGERRGVKLPGCDFGNSPSEFADYDFTGKTVIHTTTAGTQGLDNALQADVVLTGSLVNAKAIVKYIRQQGFEEVSLVPMGAAAVNPSQEDSLCAIYLERLLKGEDPDLSAELEGLKTGGGARFFDPERLEAPLEDYDMCTKMNIFDFVLRAERAQDGRLRSIKINV